MAILLGFSETELTSGGAIHTAQEIARQPEVFESLLTLLNAHRADAKAFLQKACQNGGYDIIMTGAGSSEMIGNALAPVLYPFHTAGQIRSIGTTSLLTSPQLYFDKPERPTVLVSFARSGNSPESVACVELADQLLTNVYHLMITCNSEGELAKRSANMPNAFCMLMPPETNDKGFAMTSSVTAMYLSGYALLSGMCADAFAKQLHLTAAAAREMISQFDAKYIKLATAGYERIVYLGADNLKGTSQECALKTLELTNGGLPTLFDTPMGFRHGPKSFVTDKTLVVNFLSKDDYTRLYEIDILHELYNGPRKCGVAAVSFTNKIASEYADCCHTDFTITNAESDKLDQPFLSVLYVIFGQILAFGVSFCNGHTTDTPCPDKAVSRVVSGVILHPYTN